MFTSGRWGFSLASSIVNRWTPPPRLAVSRLRAYSTDAAILRGLDFHRVAILGDGGAAAAFAAALPSALRFSRRGTWPPDLSDVDLVVNATSERDDVLVELRAGQTLVDLPYPRTATAVAADFHARYSALSRTYRYVLYNHPIRPALLAGRTGWFHLPLDLERMRKAVDCLVGEHDFSAFRSAECQAKTPVRIMQSARIRASGAYFLFDFTANAFLHHMVRNIVGCLVYIGKGNQPPQWISELIAAQDRRLAAPTFSADGLYLFGVRYDARWSLPEFPPMMPFDLESGR